LNAGIDVYTTLNIQHLESFRDMIAQITGVIQRETVPDRVLDEATEIEVVDLPPEELLLRLREGKVYIPEQAARAVEHFFEPGNLIALREITLRRAASRVDEQMRAYLETYSTPELWPVTERLLVCLSGGPSSEKLIRTARRLAEEQKTEWYVLYVETAGTDKLTQENRERIWRELRLAESLGAKEVTTLMANSAVQAVFDYARKHKITRVIVGRPTRPRWREWLRGSFVDQLLRQSKDIDIYVVSDGSTKREKAAPPPPERAPWQRYVSSLLLVAGATLVSKIAVEFLSATNMIMFYLLAVVVAALRLGFIPAILTAALGVLAFDFFLVPPHFSFSVADTQYLITFAGLLTVGTVISTLVARARSHTETIKTREAQTATLYALSRDLSSAPSLKAILDAFIYHVGDAADAQVAILLPEGETLKLQASSSDFSLEEKDISVALWAFRNGQKAGKGTDTLSSSELIYFPLPTIGKIVGVMAIRLSRSEEELPPESLRLLEAFAVQVALAIERAHLAWEAEQAQLLQATERLERSLLNSISHDLRTPLSSITGALSSLREETRHQEPGARRELIDLAWEEAGRMNRFISNLLDITRLEAGALKIKKEPYDVQDLVGSCLASLEPRLKEKVVRINIPPNLPLVPMDSVLLAEVLNNLVDNALKYSPTEGAIEISARTQENWLQMEVADQGRGIPEEHLTQVFNKFFRISHNEATRGTGLGLAISKGIIEAHGGRIWAANRPEGGLRVTFSLPLTDSAGGKKSEA
jgi:two-component system sensor histidine kinase KdpD